MKEIEHMSIDINDFEEHLMLTWNIIKDIETVLTDIGEHPINSDRLINMLIGLVELYEVRFSKLYDMHEVLYKSLGAYRKFEHDSADGQFDVTLDTIRHGDVVCGDYRGNQQIDNKIDVHINDITERLRAVDDPVSLYNIKVQGINKRLNDRFGDSYDEASDDILAALRSDVFIPLDDDA